MGTGPEPTPRGPEGREPDRRRAERSRTFRRRRVLALVAGAALLALAVRAIADDANDPPRFAGGAEGPEATPEEAEPVQLTVAATGDFLIHSPVFAVALENGGGGRYDFAPMFEEIKPYIEDADVGICHVETPMTDAEPTGYPVFNTPPSLARAIAATGWDACSTASNHSLDQGEEGIEQTNDALDRAGIQHTGTAASRAEREPALVQAQGVDVALLSYTEMTNGIPVPDPWAVNLTDADRILADARAARDDGAEVVIVNLHAGEEFVAEPSRTQKKLADALTRSEAVTAVIGQHVHIPQPIEVVNGELVVYGEGNLVSNQDAACCPEASQDGIIALLDIVVDEEGARVDRVRYVPVYVRRPDYTVLAVGDALRSGEADAAALRASYERTREVVGAGPRVQPEPRRLP